MSGPYTAPGNLSPLNAVFLLPAELFVQLRRLKNAYSYPVSCGTCSTLLAKCRVQNKSAVCKNVREQLSVFEWKK